MLAAPGFPYRYGATYAEFRGPEGDANPNLLTEPAFQGRQLGPAEVPAVAARIKEYRQDGYIAFTKDETEYAEVFGSRPPGALRSLEAAVAQSPDFRLWYGNSGRANIRTGGPTQAIEPPDDSTAGRHAWIL